MHLRRFFNDYKIYKMKIYISIFSIFLGYASANAQDITDALRYSQTELNGTARFSALSGAFGALGGDLSAVTVNPASSVVFANNQVAVSLSNYGVKNESNYFGSKNTNRFNNLDFNQAGGVLVFENNNSSSSWKKFAVSINYDNLTNFDNNLFANGINNHRSIGDYFLEYANMGGGISITNLQIQPNSSLSETYTNFRYFEDQQAFLGFQAYIIDAASDYNETSNRKYVSLVPSGGGYYQENSITNRGYNGKLAFNASAQYADKLLIGINLNSHFTDYTRNSSFYESNQNNNTTNNLVKEVYFNNTLHTYGSGFSFQLGVIYKFTPEFRAGITYESPTWMRLNDELTQSLKAISGSINGNLTPDIADPNVTLIYKPYTLSTPDKWTFSGAYVFGKEGFISVDYSTKNYGSIDFSPSNDFKSLNNAIPEILTRANEFRLGIERKIKEWSLRGGYRFESSPYKDKNIMGDLTGFSAGIGYNWGETKLDFAYSTAKRTYSERMFNTGLTDAASVTKVNSNITVTLAFEL